MRDNGKLDEDQYTWLANTLHDTPSSTPVCVISHIPIMAVNGLLDGYNEASGDWVLPGVNYLNDGAISGNWWNGAYS